MIARPVVRQEGYGMPPCRMFVPPREHISAADSRVARNTVKSTGSAGDIRCSRNPPPPTQLRGSPSVASTCAANPATSSPLPISAATWNRRKGPELPSTAPRPRAYWNLPVPRTGTATAICSRPGGRPVVERAGRPGGRPVVERAGRPGGRPVVEGAGGAGDGAGGSAATAGVEGAAAGGPPWSHRRPPNNAPPLSSIATTP